MVCVWVDRSRILLPICTVYRVVVVFEPPVRSPGFIGGPNNDCFVLIEIGFSAKCNGLGFILYALWIFWGWFCSGILEVPRRNGSEEEALWNIRSTTRVLVGAIQQFMNRTICQSYGHIPLLHAGVISAMAIGSLHCHLLAPTAYASLEPGRIWPAALIAYRVQSTYSIHCRAPAHAIPRRYLERSARTRAITMSSSLNLGSCAENKSSALYHTKYIAQSALRTPYLE